MLLEFEKTLAGFIEAHDLFGSAARVVLAVSGGADSTALLYAMQALRAENVLSAELVCAHINHQLRGVDADVDGEFVVAQTAKLKLALTTKQVDVRGFAHHNRLSIETAARQLRIEALTEVARTHHCDRIATGHQKNDNAETILHRLARGTGFRGLCAIWPKRVFADDITFVRPLLCVTRHEIIEYLQARNLTWCQDRTNADCTYRRNYIRHRLIPALQRDCSDSLVEALSELAHSARKFYGRVCKRADAVWPSVAECTAGATTLDVKRFQTQPQPVRVELIRRSLTHIGCGQRDLARRHYEGIVRLATQSIAGGQTELPGGFSVRRDYGDLIFSRNRPAVCKVDLSLSVSLNVPGRTRFGKYLIEATICAAEQNAFTPPSVSGPAPRAKGCLLECFDLGKVDLPLSVRLRRPGDRFVPLGLGREKKIGKFLTAQRVPHGVREKVVLVADQEKIIWVWPIRISEQAKVTSDTRRILQLQITDRA